MNIFDMGGHLLVLLQAVFSFWNRQVGLVFDMLGQSPSEFKGGGAWNTILRMQPIFVAVGSSLVALFFVIGFCSESVDIREEMRFEVILRMLIRLTIAEFFVVNSVTIMQSVFAVIGNLVSRLSMGSFSQLSISTEQAETIKNLGFFPGLIMLLISVLLSAIVLICGFFILYTVYFRFLRLLVLIPLGSIAFSTMGGNRMVSHTAVSYAKYFLSVCMEAITMALAIVVCNAFINAGLPSFAENYGDWTKTLVYLSEMTFSVALTVESVKGAQSLTSKIFGL